MRSLRTFCPSGAVWCVFSIMPRIFPAHSRTSSGDFATFTPPPLPRPPAWICAFTTHAFPPSSRAAFTASSTEKQGTPRGVATPYLHRISLAWYSWIFMLVLLRRFEGRIVLQRRRTRIDGSQAGRIPRPASPPERVTCLEASRVSMDGTVGEAECSHER